MPCAIRLWRALPFPPHSVPTSLFAVGGAVSACYIHLVSAALSVPHVCFVMCPCHCSTRIKSVSFPCPTSSGLLS